MLIFGFLCSIKILSILLDYVIFKTKFWDALLETATASLHRTTLISKLLTQAAHCQKKNRTWTTFMSLKLRSSEDDKSDDLWFKYVTMVIRKRQVTSDMTLIILLPWGSKVDFLQSLLISSLYFPRQDQDEGLMRIAESLFVLGFTLKGIYLSNANIHCQNRRENVHSFIFV